VANPVTYLGRRDQVDAEDVGLVPMFENTMRHFVMSEDDETTLEAQVGQEDQAKLKEFKSFLRSRRCEDYLADTQVWQSGSQA